MNVAGQRLGVRRLSVVDTHTVGEPTRVVTGFPLVRGGSLTEIKNDMQENHDWFRRFILHEPRGHSDMFGAVLFPSEDGKSDLGVIFMDNGGYLDMCGHGTIGVVTCAIQTGLIKAKPEILLDTTAGIVTARPKYVGRRVQSVSFVGVPSFKLKTTEIEVMGRSVPVDITFGGNFFAHVFCSDFGFSIEPRNKSKIIELGVKVRDTVNEKGGITHSYMSHINKVELVEFSGPSKSKIAHAQNVVVFGRGQLDRSPCGTGTCAKMAILHSEGKLKVGDSFIHEGILATMFTGRIISETKVGDYDAIVPEITGSAFITGYNELVADEEDPLSEGFLI